MYQKEVYHSSPTQELKKILPYKSTHGPRWVYAALDQAMSTAFLGRTGGDFTCSLGRDSNTGKPYICERFPGAFDLRYGKLKGSIYTLPGVTFQEGLTSWKEEVVSEIAVIPLSELQIEDARSYLLYLQKAEEVILNFYPERLSFIPEDDSDLVEKAVRWAQQGRQKVLEQVKEYHPKLLPRVLERLK